MEDMSLIVYLIGRYVCQTVHYSVRDCNRWRAWGYHGGGALALHAENHLWIAERFH